MKTRLSDRLRRPHGFRSRLAVSALPFLGGQFVCLPAQDGRSAVIADHDALSNMLTGATKQSAVVTRIVHKTKNFTVYPNNGS